jgi:hypothetical protein
VKKSKEQKRTISIPRVGYFAIGPHGIRRDGVPEFYEHKLAQSPNIGLDDVVKLFSSEGPRPFKSYLVEGIENVRRYGRMPYTSAHHWLEANGLIEAFEGDCNSPGFIDVKYRVTEKGEEFMQQHEAPMEWA